LCPQGKDSTRGQALSGGFRFDLQAKRTRLTDSQLIAALQGAAETLGGAYFASTKYDAIPGKRPHSSTVIQRFGSWKKALAIIGIAGGRERRHSPDELIQNLQCAWEEIGFPPGKRKIAMLGRRISESPYRRHWGSLRAACESLAAFQEGRISREELLAGRVDVPVRMTISLTDRWAVLKRDNYRCVRCGASPSSDHSVELEVDHITPVASGGRNNIENLQTLCRKCNQGKKDR
jgi:hypothetical protein